MTAIYKNKLATDKTVQYVTSEMEGERHRIKEIPSLLNGAIQTIDIDVPNHFWNYCVNCGTPLDSRKCKLFCPQCGFYHNCSEP